MKQQLIYSFLLLSISLACSTGHKKAGKKTVDETAISSVPQETSGNLFPQANKILTLDKNIRSIFQDKNGNYWFGTNTSGVYAYDGKSLYQFTTKDGLASNQVQQIQEDQSGKLWFGTGGFGVSRYDGEQFVTFTTKEKINLNPVSELVPTPNDLWFFGGGGVFHYRGDGLDYLSLDKSLPGTKLAASAPFDLSPFAVYSILQDKKGNLWFGTQAHGVYKYDGKSLTSFTEKGLSGPAVLALFEDSKGNIWFGNNGAGLFRYDGKLVSNLTEESGLGNRNFRASGKANATSLARIYAINEDSYGNLWIGTVDAGVWKYDGRSFTNYANKNGLNSQAVNTIYKDRQGELWFGTDSDGIFKFDGKKFSEYKLNLEK